MSSESEFDDEPLPVNLHFRDERALTVDIDAVMSSGRRMRRNRKAFAGVVAAVAVGVLGVSAAYLAPTSSSRAPVVSAAPSTGAGQSSTALDFLAGGGHVTVLSSRVNAQAGFTLSVVAWRAGPSICSGTADLAGGTSNSSITCGSRPSALSATRPTVLAPHLVTGVTDDLGAQVAIGFVSGDVAKVSLKIRGHLYDATVVALPGSPSTGAYAVWIDPKDFVTTSRDFTQIIGYGSGGAVVTG
jgi:hypothetical protein